MASNSPALRARPKPSFPLKYFWSRWLGWSMNRFHEQYKHESEILLFNTYSLESAHEWAAYYAIPLIRIAVLQAVSDGAQFWGHLIRMPELGSFLSQNVLTYGEFVTDPNQSGLQFYYDQNSSIQYNSDTLAQTTEQQILIEVKKFVAQYYSSATGNQVAAQSN